jgi:DNA-binding NarL/FixJ family response regulator
LVIDDHEMMALGLSQVLLARQDIVACAVAGTATEVNDKIQFESFDLVLLDINLPDGSGIHLIELLRQHNSAVKIIAVSGNMAPSLITQLKSRGVNGVYDKGDSSQELIRVVDQVLSGASEVISHKIELMNGKAKAYNLSKRQFEVLHYLAQGLTNKEISFQQKLSQATVAFHVAELRKKLNCKTSREILKVARQSGIIS